MSEKHTQGQTPETRGETRQKSCSGLPSMENLADIHRPQVLPDEQ